MAIDMGVWPYTICLWHVVLEILPQRYPQVPHASIDPELSVLAVLRVHAGGPGVNPASAATELHLAREEGAGMVVTGGGERVGQLRQQKNQ